MSSSRLTRSVLAGLLLASLIGVADTSYSAADRRRRPELWDCWQQYVGTLKGQVLKLDFTQQREIPYHSPRPWMTIQYSHGGSAWAGEEIFSRSDSMRTASNRVYHGARLLKPGALMYRDYGDTTVSPVTEQDWFDELFESAKISPAYLLSFLLNVPLASATHDGALQRYTFEVRKTHVTVVVDGQDRASSVELLTHDPLQGDLRSIYTYDHDTLLGSVRVPTHITVSESNGHRAGTVSIGAIAIVPKEEASILAAPTYFQFSSDDKKAPSVITKHLSAHVHTIELASANSRATVIEFKDFVMVVDAPLSSENGELIRSEIRTFAPGKPVRYYAFSHHHPWYVGGMRPFIREGASIITTPDDIPYLTYLATNPRSLVPDSLSLHPTPMKTTELRDSLLITDGAYQAIIYHIGMKSQHTEDYAMIYLPEERIILEGDLADIPLTNAKPSENPRQKGLYNAVRSRSLVVDTVVQSWPIASTRVRTLFSLSDLEANTKLP